MSSFDVSATIAQLFIHPIKSCAGVEVREVLLTPTGLQYDRHWLLVDAAGRFVTQRELARMVLIQPSIDATDLIVNAPNMSEFKIALDARGDEVSVQIWDDVVSAFDLGDAAGAWFSEFLGQTVRLVRFNPDKPRLCSTKWSGGVQADTQFADGYPILVTTTAAVDELNQKLNDKHFAPVNQTRFRPNIVLADLPAHDEDLLDVLHIDEAQLKICKPCERCPIPSIDPATAVYQPEAVSDTIQTYRADARLDGAITFGMNAIVLHGAGQMLRVGQGVAANYVF